MTFLPSVREKEENMKTVESLLEKGLIEVANKEEELKVCVKKKKICHRCHRLKKHLKTCRVTHTHLAQISIL